MDFQADGTVGKMVLPATTFTGFSTDPTSVVSEVLLSLREVGGGRYWNGTAWDLSENEFSASIYSSYLSGNGKM